MARRSSHALSKKQFLLQQTARMRARQREGKYAAQMTQEISSSQRVDVKQYLALVYVPRTARLAPGAQLKMVVDLAFEGDVVTPTSRSHGLRAARAQVEDGQPTVRRPESAKRVAPQPGVIGAGRMQGYAHPKQRHSIC